MMIYLESKQKLKPVYTTYLTTQNLIQFNF